MNLAPDTRWLRVRIATAMHQVTLTSALAHGAVEGENPRLTLRAHQLTTDRKRRSMARAMRRAIVEAHRPPLARARLTLIRSSAVLEAEDAINALIGRLASPAPVRPEGMAMIELLLNNAECSPLYNVYEPGTLRRRIRLATAALDDAPTSSRWHEFSLTA